MDKKFFVLFCLILFVCSVSFASASDNLNQSISEDIQSDDGIVIDAGAGTFSELKEKIINPENGSTVNLDKDYLYDGEFGGEGIFINNTITVNGNGHTIDGNHATRIFDIGASVVLTNIVFVNGQGENDGGAIFSKSNLKLNNCSFINCSSESGGGAINIFESLLIIKNCSFIDNKAGSGGAIFIHGSEVLIENSLFLNNTLLVNGTYDWINGGGAILIESSRINIKNSTFMNNKVTDNGYGGAILFIESKGLIENSLFSNNLGNGASMGFVIYCDVTVFNSTFNDGGYSKNRDSFVNNQIYISGGDSFSNPEFINIAFNDVKNQSFRIAEEGYIDIDSIEPDEFIIRKEVNFTMSVNDIVIGDDLIIDFNISSDIEQRDEYYGYAAGDVIILHYDDESQDYVCVLDDYFYFKNNNITVPALPSGNYIAHLDFRGDKYYFPKSINQSFIVYPADYNMTGNKTILNGRFEKTSDGNNRLYINLTDIDNNPLKDKEIFIKINGVTYKRTTDMNGQASIAVSLGMEGDFSVVVSFKGDDVYLPTTEIATISIPFSIHCDIFMSKYYGEPRPFVAIFWDYEGNYLSGDKATFNINGVFYTRTIDWNGQAKLNINLYPGNYTITATNPVTGAMRSCWIEILPTITDNHDLVKYYKNDSQYIVKLQGENIVGQKVTFNINGVFYERYSDDKGFAKLNINLLPNDYIITAEFNGCMVSNNISVLPVLEAKDLIMTYKDGSTFNVTLVDGHGKPYANQSVAFNINGVFYERITDENGVARLNINLMAGEYIITSSYNGCSIANKITITS